MLRRAWTKFGGEVTVLNISCRSAEQQVLRWALEGATWLPTRSWNVSGTASFHFECMQASQLSWNSWNSKLSFSLNVMRLADFSGKSCKLINQGSANFLESRAGWAPKELAAGRTGKFYVKNLITGLDHPPHHDVMSLLSYLQKHWEETWRFLVFCSGLF